jgi:hypothetical protein
MYRNEYDRDGSAASMGFFAVKRFDETIESLGGVSTPSTEHDDIHKHIDRHVDLYNNKFSVDVKSAKATNRGGVITIDHVWVEFKNVQGNNGWLYGEEDFLAFETNKHKFVLVGRKLLAEFCETSVDLTAKVTSANDALYKAYTRTEHGRNDIISRIPLTDIKSIKHTMLIKKEN